MKKFIPILFLLAACSSADSSPQITQTQNANPVSNEAPMAAPVRSDGMKTAIFAGGCFWCVESDFEKLAGVSEVVSGYSGDDMLNPTYRNHANHLEVAKVIYDPSVVTYKELIDHYWRTVDPTDAGGQFCDRGNAYKTAIYAYPDQIEIAKASKAEIIETKPFSDPIVTPVLPAKTFWDAEDYHQDYYIKNPRKYKYYRNSCGRDRRTAQLWGAK